MSDERTYTIHMSHEDISNLLVFMERTTLKGNEVPIYNKLVNTLIRTSDSDSVRSDPTRVPRVKFGMNDELGG